MSVPRLEHNSTMATAITILRDEVLIEPVRVLNDSWVVRRDGRLVPLDQIEPEPGALLLVSGFVEDGNHRRWSGIREFLLDHGIAISWQDAKRAEREGRVRPYRIPVEPRREHGCDTGLAKTLARGLAA